MSISQKHQKRENDMVVIVSNFEITVAQPVRIVHFDSLIISRNAELKMVRTVSGSSVASIIAACVFI